MTKTTIATAEQTAATIIDDLLPEDVALRLGVLAGVDERQARANLGLRGYSTATLLKTLGLVEYDDHWAAAFTLAKNPDDPEGIRRVAVTDLGREVMTACQTMLPADNETREQLVNQVLDVTDDRRVVLVNSVNGAPNPAFTMLAYLDLLKQPPTV